MAMAHSGRWTQQEHARFLTGLERHGRCWKKVAGVVRTRTREQCRVHFQKYELKEAKIRNPDQTNRGPWTDEEHNLFLKCWAKYGRSWTKLAQVITTRTNEQIRTHAQKYFSKLEQLRSLGYDGQYTMDGRRHLTKSFVKNSMKQQAADRKQRQLSSRPSPFEAMSYSQLKALATEKGLLPRPINKRLITRDYLMIILEQSGVDPELFPADSNSSISNKSPVTSCSDGDHDDQDEEMDVAEDDDESIGSISSDDAEDTAEHWAGEGGMDPDDGDARMAAADDDDDDCEDLSDEEEEDDGVKFESSTFISGPWAMMMESRGRKWRTGQQRGDGFVRPGRRPSAGECKHRVSDHRGGKDPPSSCPPKPEDVEGQDFDDDVTGGDDTTFFAKLLLGIKGVKQLAEASPSSDTNGAVIKKEEIGEGEEDMKPACEALSCVAAAAVEVDRQASGK